MQYDMREARLAYIFANMSDAVCITRKNGAVLHVNNSAGKLFGLTDYTDMKIWDVIRFTETNDNLIQLFLDAVTQGKDISSLVEYEANDGKVFNLHVNMTYMDEGNGIFVMVARDLTELVRVNSAFERYTSPEIAKYVLTSPEGAKQGGQTRDVTIMMSDLRGFTAMSTKLHPDTLITVLNHYFEAMIAVISHYNGTVLEFLGDGIFVVFGAPIDDENHAENAVACAVEMQNAMKSVNEWNAEHSYPELEMGIGINTGPAVVGNIGSADKMKYGCMGETVNLAGRVETFTVGGQVYISERTKAQIASELTISAEQSFMPKGAATPMKIYAVEGIGEVHMKHVDYVMRETVRKPAVTFFNVEGKNVAGEGHTCIVESVSSDERYAVIESDAHVDAMQNIVINTGGGLLYAKAESVSGRQITICFTSKPDNFPVWLKSLF